MGLAALGRPYGGFHHHPSANAITSNNECNVHNRHRIRYSAAPAFWLIEVSVCTVLVGLILVTALKASGAAIRAFARTGDSQKAVLLAEDLMAEIIQQHYLEPIDTPTFGSEGDEADEEDGPRTLWDDADDYKLWDKTPPQEKDGTVIPNLTGWRRWVEVKHVDPNDFSILLTNGDDQGVKRITVNVSHNGTTLASLVSYHTNAWTAMIPDPGNTRTAGAAPPVNQPPVALVAGNPTSGTETVNVTFDASGSFDPEGQDLTCAWDFGDGGTGSGIAPTHLYTNYSENTKVRTVTLTVTDVYGAQDQDTMSITIYGD